MSTPSATVPMIVSNKDAMSGIATFEDAMQVLQDSGVAIANVSSLIGDGFKVLENKQQLIDVPFMIMGFEFYMGDNGEFVAMHVVTRTNQKLIVNDGGTGIFRQCKELAEKGVRTGFVENGLKESRFRYDEASGAIVKPNDPGYADAKTASTFYLS